MANLFEVTDPRGYQIVCSDDAWSHILGNRPWMKDWDEIIKQALENPTMGIYQDVDYAERQVYYMFRIVGKDRYLKVVVEITGEDTGEVVTAFPTFTPKPGEKLIWPTSNP
jgi:lipopolysaccharide biosynthesis glycosyltransferase